MKSKVHVVYQDGKWKLSESSRPRSISGVYNTKSEAISAARNTPNLGQLIIHTSTGQIIRTPDVKTSRDKNVMREAVLNAVNGSDKQH
ncbi:MAG TPA: DUF2188 domain-containing protein [Duganella sp.]|uniref:DUF2188 domain-containing protein n=1 Tax=Duganella sp. TaxID=1904440 RepID=UPI002ED1DF66